MGGHIWGSERESGVLSQWLGQRGLLTCYLATTVKGDVTTGDLKSFVRAERMAPRAPVRQMVRVVLCSPPVSPQLDTAWADLLMALRAVRGRVPRGQSWGLAQCVCGG